MIGIYKITNLKNGRFYIGKSVNVKRRYSQHFTNNAKGHTKLFDEDIAKYGKVNFSLEVLEECSKENLLDREAFYIQELKPEYNGCIRGGKRNDEFCKAVSNGTKEWWDNLDEKTTERIKRNLTGPKIGHEVSEETREKLRKANLGKKQSKETVEKRKKSLAAKFAEKPKDGSGHWKKVGCDGYDQPFESVKSCAECLQVHPSTVTKAIKRNGKVKGYKVWYVV